MRIARVRIRNFRGIRSLDLDLGPVTVLIGENNSGKTSVLDALISTPRGHSGDHSSRTRNRPWRRSWRLRKSSRR